MAGHDLPTSQKAIKKIIKIIKKRKYEKANFYDLGCGRGDVVFAIKKNFPDFSVQGIEKRSLQIFFTKFRNFFLRRDIIFQKNDLFEISLEKADIIYTYLRYDLMPEIEKKLKNELKKGVLVITNTTSFPNWQPEEIHIVHPKQPNFEKLFVYIKK
ncbi:MAG: hypothetical protein QME61_00720 [Patescibacteria group bacterium]|nr:hypothetical protein [Patescibacteria group bacterium]